jgi:hypothetical protein
MNCGACDVYVQNLKCCTFYPDLANFAVGEILLENTSSRLPEILRNLTSAEIALPLGMKAPNLYKEKYKVAAFGQSEDLLCPYFDRLNLNCSIWKSRPSSCVRYVCKSSLDGLGQTIWEETEKALNSLEVNLAYEAAIQRGLVNYEIHRDSWNASSDEKRDFYIETAKYVHSLSETAKVDLAADAFANSRARILSLAQESKLC